LKGLIDYSNKPVLAKEKNKKEVSRQALFEHWASWRCLFKFQPIQEIEEYFGPKVAFYFAWLGKSF
jgi:hypothetical protein